MYLLHWYQSPPCPLFLGCYLQYLSLPFFFVYIDINVVFPYTQDSSLPSSNHFHTSFHYLSPTKSSYHKYCYTFLQTPSLSNLSPSKLHHFQISLLPNILHRFQISNLSLQNYITSKCLTSLPLSNSKPLHDLPPQQIRTLNSPM